MRELGGGPSRAYAWPEPGGDQAYDPSARARCPECGASVGHRGGRLNRHLVAPPPGAGPGWRDLDGATASPLGKDGWCRGGGSPALHEKVTTRPRL